MADIFEDEELFDEDDLFTLILSDIADLMVEETLEEATDHIVKLLFWCWAEARSWVEFWDDATVDDDEGFGFRSDDQQTKA